MAPEGWRATKLGDELMATVGGGTPNRSNASYWGGSIPWATVKDFGPRVLLETQEHISEEGLRSSASNLVPANTVVMATRMNVGAVFRSGVPIAINQDLRALIPARSLSTDYLFYFLQENSNALGRLATGTTVKGLRTDTLRSLQVQLPPLPEQRKIADILSSVDDAIEKTQAVIDQVQVVKRSLMQELLSRGIPGRHTRFKRTEIGEIPAEWAIVRIIDVADVDYGISAAVSANSDPDIGWPILTGANLTLEGQIDLSKLVYHKPPSKERFYLRKNDLLLNWRSGSPKHVGKTALFDLDGNYTYASFVLRIRSRGKLVPGFGHILLNFMRNAELFSKDLSQQVNFKMNAAVFREVLIRLPSVDEQEEISLTVARIDSRLTGETQLLAALKNVKSALMSVLLTGELRVSPNTEAA